MTQLITSQQDADQWLAYVESEAISLSHLDEFSINNYVDSELLNPEVQDYLLNEYVDLGGEETLSDSIKNLSLSFAQNRIAGQEALLFGRWAKIKATIRKIFCTVIGTVLGDGDLKWKDIIKAVLLALIPAFGAGLPLITLPVVVSLVAALMKYGYQSVCPA